MYRSKYAVFRQDFSWKIVRRPSIYKDLSHFCVIITRASTRLTIPVAFIYSLLVNSRITMLVFVKTRRLYRKIHIHLDTEHFLLYPISKRHLFSWEAPVETRSDTKRRNAFYLQQSLYSKIKRGYSFHKIMYRPTEQVERCQCCL